MATEILPRFPSLEAPPSAAGAPVAAKGSLALHGFISAWAQDCSAGSCSLPAPAAQNEAVDAVLALPERPGTIRRTSAERSLKVPGANPLIVRVTMFAVCPRSGPTFAVRGCSAPYVQTQVELSGAASAFCGAAQSLGDAAPFPVLMCAGAGSGGRRIGVTLHRRAF